LFTAAGNWLFALDPKTGVLIKSFGDQGMIALGAGLDVEKEPKIGLNTPGIIYRDLLIMGGFGGPGAVRAIDVRTGARRWIFHLIPRPGDFGHETWPADA
jgi:quinoprotein glucose dehydrogenase